MAKIKATTILGILKTGEVAIGGDGQVTLNDVVMKHKAKKIRTLYDGKVLAGFAGSAADAFALLQRFENKLEEFHGNLERAAVELAQEWRTDKYLRRLDALLAVLNSEKGLIISGQGDVIEPDDNILGIGSGAGYAIAAARGLEYANPDMPATEIIRKALEIAGDIGIYTNKQITVLSLKK